VKTLADPGANSINFTPKDRTVPTLRAIAPPNFAPDLGRQPPERVVYRVKARLVAFKIEADSDVHLVVADPSVQNATMIVEFPAESCDVSASEERRVAMAAAREALVSACGRPGEVGFRRLEGTATITGVAFFDRIHGQNGVAPNGIELHPALRFQSSDCRSVG